MAIEADSIVQHPSLWKVKKEEEEEEMEKNKKNV